MKKSLYPNPEPITINSAKFILGMLVFALLFFAIGLLTRHYVTLHSVGV